MRIKIELTDTPAHRALNSGDDFFGFPIAFTIPGYLHALVEMPDGASDTTIEAFMQARLDEGEIVKDENGFFWRHEKEYSVLGFEDDSPHALAVGDTFALHGINPDVLERGRHGEGATIAILDTGVFAGHEMFSGVDLSGDLYDGHGHGTHVASTAAGNRGVAPRARIRSFKVLSDSGSGSEFGIANAIRAAADEGDDVISMSLGGGGSQVMDDACQYAIAQGAVVVSAAGNGGSTSPIGSPARASSLIVMAHDRGNQWAGFTDGRNSTAPNRVGANGVSIDAARAGTTSGITTMSGTSMACPHMAGFAALLAAAAPTNIVSYILGHRSNPPSSPGKIVMLADFGAVEPPPPPPPPPEPEPEYPVVEIAPGIWDGRSVVSNPLGRLRADGSVIKMGVLVGQATHHTVTAMLMALPSVSQASHASEEMQHLALVALQLGDALAFDSTIEQELEHIRAIDAYHKSLGWGGFAYNGIAYASRRAYLCGNLDGQRAHVEGRNHELNGLAFNGDFTSELPPEPMLAAGANFLRFVRQQTGTSLPINGHSEWGTATVCPGTLAGFDWEPWLEPAPPPAGVRVKRVTRTGGNPPRLMINFEGNGWVELREDSPWVLDIVSESGAMVSEIRAP